MDNLLAIFNASPVGMLISDENMQIIQVNEALLSLCGKTHSQVIGRRFGDALGLCCRSDSEQDCGHNVHCKDCELFKALCMALESGQPAINLECRKAFVQKERKTELWFRINAAPVTVEGKSCVVVSLLDITEKKNAEENVIRSIAELREREKALHESEEKFREIFHNSSDSIIIQEVQDNCLSGRIIEVNDTACHDWGFSREEFLNMSPAVAESYNRIAEIKGLADILGERGHAVIETIVPEKGNVVRSVELNSRRITLNGRPAQMTILRDITDRVRAEQALFNSEEKFHQLFHNLEDMVFVNIVSTDSLLSRCIEANSAACRRLGYSREELLKMFPADFIPEESMRELYNIGKRLLQEKHLTFETLVMTRDGQKIPVEICSHVFCMNGEDLVLSVARDITERKKASEEMRAARDAAESANRAKSEFLANMSHEIRTPLNGVTGMIDITLMTGLTELQRENLETAKKCANALLTLINDILDFSRMEAGKLAIEKIDFNIRQLIEDVMKTHSNAAQSKGIGLDCNYSAKVEDSLVGDPNRLQQILNNLINNSIKFTEAGGVTLTVSGGKVQDDSVELKFSVSDTGIGIEHDKINKLFKSFSQVDSSFTRKYGGTGLGLAISRQLVELMGGKIWAESEKGIGSTFSFTLSFEPGNQPAGSANETGFGVDERKLQVLLDIGRHVKQLTRVVVGNNPEDIEAAAREIRNLADQIKADELKNAAFQMELAARRGGLEGIQEYAVQIEQRLEAVITALL